MYDNAKALTIIAKVGAVLRQPLVYSEPKSVKAALTALECLSVDLLEARVEWQQLLDEKKSQYLHPKDKDLTEMDRKISLNASLANITRDYEFLVGLEKLVAQRMELGRALL